MNRAHGREVTADGMTRVVAVVAAMVESNRVSATGSEAAGSLDDLIAKAAQVVEHHVSSTQVLRRRGLTLHRTARASLDTAQGGQVGAAAPKLDVIR